ncbi:MAG: tyrosine-type recombinase/integrase [Acidimicrobiia bacterium]|nr:tyrosine-type recombinase/integrase [Acidimicrobiia bacterium]
MRREKTRDLSRRVRHTSPDGRYTAHSFRRGAAQGLTRRGLPPQTVSEIIGWKSAEMAAEYDARRLRIGTYRNNPSAKDPAGRLGG